MKKLLLYTGLVMTLLSPALADRTGWDDILYYRCRMGAPVLHYGTTVEGRKFLCEGKDLHRRWGKAKRREAAEKNHGARPTPHEERSNTVENMMWRMCEDHVGHLRQKGIHDPVPQCVNLIKTGDWRANLWYERGSLEPDS